MRVTVETDTGKVEFVLQWNNKMHRTETAPEEGGDYETVDAIVTGHVTDDEMADLEEQAYAIAYERDEAMRYDNPWI